MTEQEKQLLLQDLCARLPYGVICEGITKDYDGDKDLYVNETVNDQLTDIHRYKCTYVTLGLTDKCEIEQVKPYLRPMSSMTKKEKKEYDKLRISYYKYAKDASLVLIDWLNAHHFDHRGLIEKGLALEAPEDMYKN